jgi:16S rRNA (adenine1518-N6/adenine1519-N6)-dimethyltransferase
VARGFRPSKRLGQNFLCDGNMARAIARDSGVGPGDRVLEVGPGCGFLSLHLLELGARVLAVEIDPRLAAVARGFLGEREGFELLEADALAGKHRLNPELVARLPGEGDWHLVSNLPYSAGTPILVLLSRLPVRPGSPGPPATMTVLIQRELAERLSARPGSRAWGALAARVQALYRVEAGRTLGPDLFWPRPRVDSRVVRLVLEPRVEPDQLPALDALTAALFRERRKTLARILARPAGGREAAVRALAGLGLDPGARPETLDVPELAALVPIWAGWQASGS